MPTNGRRRDVALLFVSRSVRMAAYGALAVVLALYLAELGLSATEVGAVLSLTLGGDALVSLYLSLHADRFGRRRTLALGALLMVLGGLVFASTSEPWILLIAATVAVISPTGSEVGPFLAVEQASLSQVLPAGRRTGAFAWYQLFGAGASAVGALAAGLIVQVGQERGLALVDAYRLVVAGYALVGVVLAVVVLRVSPEVEVPATEVPPTRLGVHRSRRVVAELAALFALDAFAGGFVIQSVVALWLHERWGVEPAALGAVFFGTNLLAGLSALAAAPLAARFGLIATMVGTHIPSNVLLILVPFMPSAESAVTVLLLRFAISQMDVPTRQSYTMAVVDTDERSAAAGLTGTARAAGAAISPSLAVPLLAVPGLSGAPFVISGVLKIVYDLVLWQRFRARRPPEETPLGERDSAAKHPGQDEQGDRDERHRDGRYGGDERPEGR